FWRRISRVFRIDSLSVGMRPGALGRARPPRLRALPPADGRRPAGGVHDADPGVHHPDLTVHHAPLFAFTIRRSARSRSRETRCRGTEEDKRTGSSSLDCLATASALQEYRAWVAAARRELR